MVVVKVNGLMCFLWVNVAVVFRSTRNRRFGGGGGGGDGGGGGNSIYHAVCVLPKKNSLDFSHDLIFVFLV
jgi:hypothetical protein